MKRCSFILTLLVLLNSIGFIASVVGNEAGPTVVITVPLGNYNGAFDATITFSAEVSDFEQSDISLSGTAKASITAFATTDNIIFKATITPTTSGTVIINVPAGVASDVANNDNTAATQQTVNVDMDRPTVTITVPTEDLTVYTGTFEVTVTFSEPVVGFEQEEFDVDYFESSTTLSITQWQISDDLTTYTAQITYTVLGDTRTSFAFDLDNNVATDAAGNGNESVLRERVRVVLQPPSVEIAGPTTSQNDAFDITITFSESVSGFEQSDISLSGTATASITAFSTTDNTVFTATITPTTSGTVIIDVPAGIATNAANNSNVASSQQTVNVDTGTPSVEIAGPTTSQNDAFDITITFSESVSGFEQSDISLLGTATASITVFSTTDNTVFTATITPTTSGTVIIDVPANVATDANNNNNTAATQQTVNVDMDPPSVVITVPLGDQNGAFDATITFSESVSDFEQSEVNLSGTATASITAFSTTDNTIFTAIITPTTTGTVIIDVPANVAKDAANNDNTAATQQTIKADLDPPSVTLQTSIQGTHPRIFKVNVIFSKAVRIYTSVTETAATYILPPFSHPYGLTVTGGDILHYNESGEDNSYTHMIRATAETVTINYDADQVSDQARNGNTAATPLVVTADIVVPSISNLQVPSGEQKGAFGVTATFSEKVHGFNGLECFYIHPAGGTINYFSDVSYSATAISDTVYTVTVTPTDGYWEVNGSIYFGTDYGSFTDIAGNLNTSQFLNNEDERVSVIKILPYDIDEDGDVDLEDVRLVTLALGQTGTGITNSRTDVNKDDNVDKSDIILVIDAAVDEAGAPSQTDILLEFSQEEVESLDAHLFIETLDAVRLESDGSLKYQQTIALLERLVASMRPETTQLLANYPNPFNPETWIPYRLSNPSQVVITIYDMRGSVVHRLELGHQREGYYTTRTRAAYWDGRNNIGEKVSSGIYFYQLRAEGVSLMRKMVILK